MTAISPKRRLLCAAVALGLSGMLFHTHLAAALVTRGDDAMRSGDITGAIRAYGRARWLDPASVIAADRLAFYLIMQHERTSAERAVAIASQVLDGGQPDSGLLADRGFAHMQLGEWGPARSDFARAAELAGDPRYDHFASRMALRAGDRADARTYARRALRRDPAFAPARAMLEDLK